jgi:hypothetical protein
VTKLDTTKFLSTEHTYADRQLYERRVEMSAMMFEPITDESEIHATLTSRSGKGESEAFLNGLENAFQEYIENNPGGHFIVPLNEREGAKFFGKRTDSLYASMYATLKRLDLTSTWRLVRVKKSKDDGTEDTFLRIVRL